MNSKKIKNLTPLAFWKLIFIEDGIDCENINDYPDINLIKTKFKKRIPTVKNLEFFDSSVDNSLIPSEIHLIDGKNVSLVKFNYNSNSQYKLIIDGRDFFVIDKKIKKPVNIKITPVKKNPYTSLKLDGKPIERWVQVLGEDRVGIYVYEGCWHWNIGKQCKFCDSNPQRNWEDMPVPSVNSLKNFKFDVDLWWDSQKEKYIKSVSYCFKKFLETSEPKPHLHLALMAGNLPNLQSIWRASIDVATELNKIYKLSDCDSYINVLAPPKENREQYLECAHNKLGFRQIQINLEVFGEKTFENVCPGKASLAGYYNSVDALIVAAKIFGNGRARSNFVLGAQPIKKLLVGVKNFAEMGIASDYSIFVPKKFTPWENKRRPKINDIVDFTLELSKIYKEYGFTPIYCERSSRSSIINEVFREI